MLNRSRQFWILTIVLSSPLVVFGAMLVVGYVAVDSIGRQVEIQQSVAAVTRGLRQYASEHGGRLPPIEERQAVRVDGYVPAEVFSIDVDGQTFDIVLRDVAFVGSGTTIPLCYVDSRAFEDAGTMVGYIDGVYFIPAPDHLQVIDRGLPVPPSARLLRK